MSKLFCLSNNWSVFTYSSQKKKQFLNKCKELELLEVIDESNSNDPCWISKKDNKIIATTKRYDAAIDRMSFMKMEADLKDVSKLMQAWGKEKTLLFAAKDRQLPQKAAGLNELKKYKSEIELKSEPVRTCAHNFKVPNFVILRTWDTTEMIRKSLVDTLGYTHTYFARPCPMVPNHGAEVGGLSSRVVQKYTDHSECDELRKMLDKLEEEDDRTTLIVMPYIKAKKSAVWVPGRYIVIGESNDGVTAGKGETWTFRDSTSRTQHFTDAMGEGYEYELLITPSQTTYCVQKRQAPDHINIGQRPTKQAVSGFVGRGVMKVKELFIVEDLDELGILEDKKPEECENLLVVQPTGSMLSHAAAHCRGLQCGFVVDLNIEKWQRAVKEGVTITDVGGWVVEGETELKKTIWRPEEYGEEILAGFYEAIPFVHLDWGKLSLFYHEFVSGPLSRTEDMARITGWYIAWLIYAGLAACVGELRHIDGCVVRFGSDEALQELGTKHFNNNSVTLAMKRLYRRILQDIVGNEQVITGSKMARGSVYDIVKSRKVSPEVAEKVLFICERAFSLWRWNSSYGGEAWARCAEFARKCLEDIRKEKVLDLLRNANILENLAHNGGNLYNKFGMTGYLSVGSYGFRLEKMESLINIIDEAKKIEEQIKNGVSTKKEIEAQDGIEFTFSALSDLTKLIAIQSPNEEMVIEKFKEVYQKVAMETSFYYIPEPPSAVKKKPSQPLWPPDVGHLKLSDTPRI